MLYDLHRHLEGSHSAHALATLAQKYQIDAFRNARGELMSAAELAVKTSLLSAGEWDPFYNAIKVARLAYVSVDAVRDATYLACIDALAECDGFELRFSLYSLTSAYLVNRKIDASQLTDAEFTAHARDMIGAIVAARAAAAKASGKPILLRAGFSRSYPVTSKVTAIADLIGAYAKELSGLDVLGAGPGANKEDLPAPLVEVLLNLRRVIPDLSIHAGELSDHTFVELALKLAPNAIGHGIRSLESARLLAELKDKRITLEVCPSSNALLIAKDVETLIAAHHAHPLVALQRNAIRCVLGSDDPSVFGTSFDNEWRIAKRYGADLAQLERDTEARWAELVARPTSGA